jgi:hypothetical protein
MKRHALPPLSCLVLMAGGFLAPSSRADDGGLQALLSKQGCAPAKVEATDLSPSVTSYEVTCKGRGKRLYIVCLDGDCRLQPIRREDPD